MYSTGRSYAFSETTNEQTAETQKLKGNSKKIAPVAIIIIIITGTGIAYWLLAPHISWLFVGAYGNYSGQATMLSIPVDFYIRFELLEFNSSGAKFLMTLNTHTFLGTIQNTSVNWFDSNSKQFTSNTTLIQSSEGSATIPVYGTRNCIIFEYAEKGVATTIYLEVDTFSNQSYHTV